MLFSIPPPPRLYLGVAEHVDAAVTPVDLQGNAGPHERKLAPVESRVSPVLPADLLPLLLQVPAMTTMVDMLVASSDAWLICCYGLALVWFGLVWFGLGSVWFLVRFGFGSWFGLVSVRFGFLLGSDGSGSVRTGFGFGFWFRRVSFRSV